MAEKGSKAEKKRPWKRSDGSGLGLDFRVTPPISQDPSLDKARAYHVRVHNEQGQSVDTRSRLQRSPLPFPIMSGCGMLS